MGWIEYYKPIIVASMLQIIYAGMTLLSRACFLQGMSPRVVCVAGAAVMALVKGPELLNGQLPSSNSLFLNSIGSDNQWLFGCLLIFGGSCCWSCWLILQVPVTRNYPDHLSLSAWMCFFGTLQSAAITIFTDPDLETWKISSLVSCLYAGVFASGIAIIAQSWIIERKGPVFSVIFNPLNAVIVTILASIFLQEQIYVGSVIGAFGIIVGLYVVLWGKAKDVKMLKEEQENKNMITPQDDEFKVTVDGPNLLDPLLPKDI